MDFGELRSALHADDVDLRRVALMIEDAPEEWVEYALEQCERRKIGLMWSAGGRLSRNPLDALDGATEGLNRVVAVGDRWRTIWSLEDDATLFDWSDEIARGLLEAYWLPWVELELARDLIEAPAHTMDVKQLWRTHQVDMGALRRAFERLGEVVDEVSVRAKRASWAAMGPNQSSPEAVAALGWDLSLIHI